jgi:putative endonuclease
VEQDLTREIMEIFNQTYYWVYVLLSEKDGNKYTGYTKNLPLRFEAHNKGKVTSTKHRLPIKLVYFEACLDQADALKREKYLKTHYGKMYLGNRLKSYFTSQEK